MPFPGSATNWTALFSRQQIGGYFVAQNMFEHPNNLWFVSSGAGTDNTGAGRSPALPFATLDYAVSHADVTTGDTFALLPGHAENLTADSDVDIDVADLSVIGLGWGSNRPTFTATAIAGDFKLAAAGIRIENLLFLSGVDATTGMLEISAADCTVLNCEFRDSVDQATDCLVALDGSDRLHIKDCTFTMAAAAGANSAIAIVSSDDVHIEGCTIYGNFAVGAIDFRTTASARTNIHDCYIWTANAADICIVDTITGSTGRIGPNLELMLNDNAANITTSVTGATFQLFDPVYVCNLVNEKGMLINWTASTHA
jgi:hypothetical protein